MRIYKHGRNYWMDFEFHGHRIRENTGIAIEGGKVTDARKVMERRKADLVTGNAPVRRSTLKWAELEQLVIDDYRLHNRRDIRNTMLRLRYLRQHFGGWTSEQITTLAVKEYVARRLKAGLANASVNRELTALSKAFTLAMESELIARRPIIKTLPEDNARQGFVTKAQFYAIHAELPEWLKDPAELMFLTGLRLGAVRKLERRDYEPERGILRVRDAISKNGEGQEIPLEGPLAEIVRREIADARPECPYLFHREGRRLAGTPTWTFWTAACAKAGLSGILIHDLRRSAVKNMVDAGNDIPLVKTISGHRSNKTFERYRIVDNENRRQALRKTFAMLEEQSNESKVVPLRGRK